MNIPRHLSNTKSNPIQSRPDPIPPKNIPDSIPNIALWSPAHCTTQPHKPDPYLCWADGLGGSVQLRR